MGQEERVRWVAAAGRVPEVLRGDGIQSAEAEAIVDALKDLYILLNK
mgnify:CR=1 FL=1